MKKTLLSTALIIGAMSAYAQDFHGSLNGNANLNYNSTKTETYNLFGRAERPFMKGNLALKGFYLYSKQKAGAAASTITDDRLSLAAKYDFNLGQGDLFGYVDLGYDRDGISGLKKRVTVGAGVGKYIRPKSELKEAGDNDWRVSAGLVQIGSTYRDRSESYLGGSLNSLYRRHLSGGIMLSHDFTYVPDLGGDDRNLWVSDLQLSKTLSGNWQVSVGYLVTHENKPSLGAQKQTSNWLIGVGYKF